MRSRLREVRVFLTHPSIAATLLGAVAVGAVSWHAFATGTGLLAFGAAFAIFPVTEYVTHRFILHAPPSRNPFVRRIQDRLHYGHHEDPENLDLLFGPLWATVPTAGAYFLVAWAVTGAPAVAGAFTCGTLLVYTYYEYAHFRAHRPIVPLTPWARWMKRFHLWHHFKNERFWFGVTSPVVDVAIGTHPRVADVERSATTRTLHPDAGND